MNTTKKIAVRRDGFTLIEMMVVIAIILALAALAAAFAPRVNDNQKMTRAVDNLEQWLLTAKMRAKRDGLSTGLRFIQAPGDANLVPGPAYSQFQYIQQPEPLSGGWMTAAGSVGGVLQSAAAGNVTFVPGSVDFTLGGAVGLTQTLVQIGDYLEINGGGVYYIQGVSGPNTLVLGSSTTNTYGSALTISNPTTNYRILRQPRILIGEEPLTLPNNYAANFGPLPPPWQTYRGCTVRIGANGINPEILFSPSGSVVGNNVGSGTDGSTTLKICVWDVPAQIELPDPNRVGVVGIQIRSGFIGAYGLSFGVLGPWYFAQSARESGL